MGHVVWGLNSIRENKLKACQMSLIHFMVSIEYLLDSHFTKAEIFKRYVLEITQCWPHNLIFMGVVDDLVLEHSNQRWLTYPAKTGVFFQTSLNLHQVVADVAFILRKSLNVVSAICEVRRRMMASDSSFESIDSEDVLAQSFTKSYR